MKKDNLLTVVYMTCNLILPDMHNFYYIGYCQVKQVHSKQFVTIPHLYFWDYTGQVAWLYIKKHDIAWSSLFMKFIAVYNWLVALILTIAS